MKKIELQKLENINGGTTIDGICAGVATGAAILGLMATIPIVNIGAGIVTGGCVAYTLLN